jgi:hypothetical protein
MVKSTAASSRLLRFRASEVSVSFSTSSLVLKPPCPSRKPALPPPHTVVMTDKVATDPISLLSRSGRRVGVKLSYTHDLNQTSLPPFGCLVPFGTKLTSALFSSYTAPTWGPLPFFRPSASPVVSSYRLPTQLSLFSTLQWLYMPPFLLGKLSSSRPLSRLQKTERWDRYDEIQYKFILKNKTTARIPLCVPYFSALSERPFPPQRPFIT